MATRIAESGGAVQQRTAGGNMLVQLISPGVGSSGVYPAEVLEAAATDRVFSAGTLMFADHPGESEMYDRPERSIRDVAGVLVEDARWDGGALVAEVKTYAPWTDVLKEMHDAIGVSIRASAEVGEADRATGKPTISRLVEGISVDFVTQAGRGGAIRQVYEAARSKATLVVRDATDPANIPVIREAMSSDVRDALQVAVQDANQGERTYAWVRDYDADASFVYFTLEAPDGAGVYQQGYTIADDGTATLTGDRVEVRARTEYVPVKPAAESSGSEATGSTDQTTNVPAPAGQSTATESEETHMATTQIEESRLAQLEKDSERVQSLESERDADRTALSEAHRVIDNGEAHTIVRTAAREADISLNDFEAAGIAADYPKGEDGRIDKEKLAESAKAAVAILAESRGAGSITGFGSTAATVSSDVVAEAEEASAAAFGRTITKEA